MLRKLNNKLNKQCACKYFFIDFHVILQTKFIFREYVINKQKEKFPSKVISVLANRGKRENSISGTYPSKSSDKFCYI